jgi:glycerophosphoryl diester phosphodiesterase
LLPGEQRPAFLQTVTDEELATFVSPQDRKSYSSGNIRLPTLKQTLEFASHADIMVNIELKTQPNVMSELADAVVRLVKFLKMDHQVLISSFDHEQLKKVRQFTETIATGILTGDRIEHLNSYLESLGADAYHPNCYSECDSTGNRKLNRYGIASVRKAGRYVNVWTCNDKDDMRQLVAAGVTGLISDFPNRIQDVLSEY